MELPQKNEMSLRYDIKRLIGKLRRHSPIRTWLERNGEIDRGSVTELLDALKSLPLPHWEDRAVTYHLLGMLGCSAEEHKRATAILLEAVRFPGGKVPFVERLVRTAVYTSVGWAGFLVLAIQLFQLQITTDWCIFIAFLAALTMPGTFMLFSFLDQARANIVQRAAATALTPISSPECLVALAQHVRPASPIREEAIQALQAIFPRITPEWYGKLPLGSNSALIGILSATENWYRILALNSGTSLTAAPETYKMYTTQLDLALAALDVLEQAGDGSAAQLVKHFAANARSLQLRQRAAAVLPLLIARRQQEDASTTLLRASSNEQTKHLVLPVYNTDPDITNLLRASNSENQNASREDPER